MLIKVRKPRPMQPIMRWTCSRSSAPRSPPRWDPCTRGWVHSCLRKMQSRANVGPSCVSIVSELTPWIFSNIHLSDLPCSPCVRRRRVQGVNSLQGSRCFLNKFSTKSRRSLRFSRLCMQTISYTTGLRWPRRHTKTVTLSTRSHRFLRPLPFPSTPTSRSTLRRSRRVGKNGTLETRRCYSMRQPGFPL